MGKLVMTPFQQSSRSRSTSSQRFLGLMIAFGVCGGFSLLMANWEWPTEALQGQEFQGSIPVVRTVPQRLRIGTFNIHSGRGEDNRFDLARTASHLTDLDFVGLNEVRGPGWNHTPNQAEQLGLRSGKRWLFAATEANWSGPVFGHGVLTNLPIAYWKTVNFPRRHGNGYRNYVECQIPLDGAGHSLTVLVTHLDRKHDRQDQLRAIIKRFLDLPPPAVLMGDLNAKQTEPQLRELRAQPGVIDCFEQFADRALAYKRIDWIFVKGVKCLDANLVATEASDHPFGWALLELNSPVND